jgi:hypothetical protein
MGGSKTVVFDSNTGVGLLCVKVTSMGKRKEPKLVYFHGGMPGLKVGDKLRSAQDQGLKFSYLVPGSKYDPESVYMATDLEVAKVYAAQFELMSSKSTAAVPGDVYRVRPLGPLRRDPDLPPISFKAPEALVLEVVKENVLLSPREREQRIGPYRFYQDGKPVYDQDGYMLPSPAMEKDARVSVEFMKLYGPWVPLLDINKHGLPRVEAKSTSERVITMMTGLLQRIPTLDSDHRIVGSAELMCPCGMTFTELENAVWHQLGEREMALIGPTLGLWDHGASQEGWMGAREWAIAAKRLSPERWSWIG